MKRTVATLAIAAAGFTATLAPAAAGFLNSSDLMQIQRVVPSADVSNLTLAQEAALVSLIVSGDIRKADENPQGQIRNILSW